MTLDIETITNSPFGINLLSGIAGNIPPPVGHRIADIAAALIASQRGSRLVRSVRCNQWVVLGEGPSPDLLDRAVRLTLRNSARSVFDLYHFIHHPEAVTGMVVLDDGMQRLIARGEFEDRGLMLVGIHVSSFDLVLRWLCSHGIKPLVLTVPDARGGRRTEYEMRKKGGMNLVPATAAGLRKALRHLEQGGAVLTGIDRPIAQPRLLPHFFGRPAALPTHHIHLATRAGVPVLVAAAMLEADGRYHVRSSPLIEMDDKGERQASTLRKAESVLRVAEGFIRRAPQQWSVPLPVWPSALDLVPEQRFT